MLLGIYREVSPHFGCERSFVRSHPKCGGIYPSNPLFQTIRSEYICLDGNLTQAEECVI